MRNTKSFTIDDLLELQDRLRGYYGYELGINRAYSADIISLSTARQIVETAREILDGKPRGAMVHEFLQEGDDWY
jgi:hypothetical protein